MTKFVAALAIASMASGCFTSMGIGVGGASRKSNPDKPHEHDTYIVEGAIAGLLIDVLLVGLVAHKLSKIGEPKPLFEDYCVANGCAPD